MARILHAEELPQLRSTRDRRQRIDLVTPETVGTQRLKGDLVVHAPDNESSAHFHPAASEVKLVLRGGGTFHINGRPHRMRAGDLVILDPGEVHHFHSDADGDLAFLEFWIPGRPETQWVNPDDP